MESLHPCSLGNLQPAGSALGNNRIKLTGLDFLEQFSANGHRNFIFVVFEAIVAGNTAAASISIGYLDSRLQRE